MSLIDSDKVVEELKALEPTCKGDAWSRKCCCWHGVGLAIDVVEGMAK